MTSSESRRRRASPLAIVLVVGLVIVLLIGGYWFFTDGPGWRLISPPGSVVAEFSGTGNQTTESFRVRPGWSIEWTNEGSQFSLAIRGDRDFGAIVEQQEPGSGTSFPTGGGTYHLDVTANGPWSVMILQGD